MGDALTAGPREAGSGRAPVLVPFGAIMPAAQSLIVLLRCRLGQRLEAEAPSSRNERYGGKDRQPRGGGPEDRRMLAGDPDPRLDSPVYGIVRQDRQQDRTARQVGDSGYDDGAGDGEGEETENVTRVVMQNLPHRHKKLGQMPH